MINMMTCQEARAQFALLLYGELSFDEENRIETHMDGCLDCRAALEREKALHAAFDGVAIEPPASLLRECRADLAASRPLRRRRSNRSGVLERQASPLSEGPACDLEIRERREGQDHRPWFHRRKASSRARYTRRW